MSALSETSVFASIPEAIDEIREGRMVIVVDDADRENEGDLIVAAERVTPEAIAFIVRHTSGVICMPVIGERLDELEVPLMVAANTDSRRTAFTVSVDARMGVTTGISAADRAARSRRSSTPRPSRATCRGRVTSSPSGTGKAVSSSGRDTRRPPSTSRGWPASSRPASCETVNEDGTMARLPDLERFARAHELKIISIADLIEYRRRREVLVHEVAEANHPHAAR